MSDRVTEFRSDLRDGRCAECSARCIPGETHAEHNLGWKKKVLMTDFLDLAMDGYPDWDLVDPGGGHRKHPPQVVLTIRNKVDRSSGEIGNELDNEIQNKFYWSEWMSDGGVFVSEGDVYFARFSFQRREDAYAFIRKYGGQAES